MNRPTVVVELGPCRRHAEALLGTEGRESFADFIARTPYAGAIIEGTGGLRKVRWSQPGTGKRGGVRIICYAHAPESPIYLFTVYDKSSVDDRSSEQMAALRLLLDGLKAELRTRGW